MVKETIIISNPTGLHTRPAKQVVAEAKKFESDITVYHQDKEANLKSLLKLMKLGISQNHSIELCCDGPDEEEALKHLTGFILSLEG
ncbi:MAG: HPr family phosphocarrier protein [Spirochaetales bacterium]|nr:HPr family phosphocarrier protein [Spirochaetales bacterium]